MKATETFLKNPNKNWFARPVDEALGAFDVERKIVLSQEGVGNARSRFGPNALPHGKKDGPVLPIARQFINPLVIILLIAASLTFFIKEYIDFTVIILAVFVNVGIGFWQEYKSNQIFEKLDKLVRVNARVRRDGKLFEIDMSELVPGDIILTGTPHGVGAFRDPPVYMKDGDEVAVEIEKVGRLVNTCKT